MPIKKGALEAITMCSYIEHSYHPYQDVLKASRTLKPCGPLYVSTFQVESQVFEKQGKEWQMFEWYHVYHFSSSTLEKMAEQAGFAGIENGMDCNAPVGQMLCRKVQW